jgi:hypothetical protein
LHRSVDDRPGDRRVRRPCHPSRDAGRLQPFRRRRRLREGRPFGHRGSVPSRRALPWCRVGSRLSRWSVDPTLDPVSGRWSRVRGLVLRYVDSTSRTALTASAPRRCGTAMPSPRKRERRRLRDERR